VPLLAGVLVTQFPDHTRLTEDNDPVLYDQLIGIIVGALGALVLLLVGIIVFCIVCRRQRTKFSAGSISKISGAQQVAAIASTMSNVCVQVIYLTLYLQTIYNSICNSRILENIPTGNTKYCN